MSPKLRAVVARAILVGGAALVATFAARHAPQDQRLAIRLTGHDVTRIEASVTKLGDDEPTAGFSQVFSSSAPTLVRHDFRAATGTYIVVITFVEKVIPTHTGPMDAAGDQSPTLTETSFERQVSLVGGEVIVSPD